ncbi:DNA primase [Myxosarcina sp. GI1]|uniref:DNA primase n=1 Tax=Myxosarcina sp. GI1 TaxID=1541065 RepID=UPI00056A3762|nr:DNA primase [Myxosarcina sp. GI1]
MSIPRLHPDTIEEVKQRVDIVDVISEHVVLRKRGKDYLGLCPFHNEKTPSFSVSQDKQLYYCFGCSEGGNTFKFLMEIGKQSFAEVVLDLARRYQVEIQTVEPEQRQELQRQLTLKEQLYEILAVAASFYRHALHQPQGEIALKYLVEQRKLQETTIDNFQLGYAPSGWETLYRYLVEQKRYPVNLVAEAGLIKERKNGKGYYDVFRDAVIIPILDTQSRIIGFGSRTLKEDNLPKYINSPETPLFDKSKTLFALDKAKSSISKEDRAVVVEGYFDAIALHEAGITNAVASLGTAFTSFQLKQLLRYTPSKQVVLNFDADNAGQKATERAIAEIEDLIYGGVVQLKILNLPDGKDADEFIKSNDDGVAIYSQSLDRAPLWLDWQIDRLVDNILEDGEGIKEIKNMQPYSLQQLAKGMVQLLDKLQDTNLRDRYLAYCADLLSQGDSRLLQQNLSSLSSQLKTLNRRIKPQKQTLQTRKKSAVIAPVQVATSPETELLQRAESLLLRIYIHCPQYRETIVNHLEDKDLLFNLSPHRFLWQQIIEIESSSIQTTEADTNFLLTELHTHSLNFPEAMAQLTKLFYLDEKTQEDIFRAEIRIAEAIASVEQVDRIKYQMYCSQQLQNLNPDTDLELIDYYYREIRDCSQKIKQLEQSRLAATQSVT